LEPCSAWRWKRRRRRHGAVALHGVARVNTTAALTLGPLSGPPDGSLTDTYVAGGLMGGYPDCILGRAVSGNEIFVNPRLP
jgi:hypothetical protein